MKYSKQFVEKAKGTYGLKDVERVLRLLDDHYPLMSDLAALYKANSKNLSRKTNIYYDKMTSLKITRKDVEIAAEYFSLEKELHKEFLSDYFKKKRYINLESTTTHKIMIP